MMGTGADLMFDTVTPILILSGGGKVCDRLACTPDSPLPMCLPIQPGSAHM